LKRLLLLLLASVLAAPLQAGPLDWAKRQFKEHPVRTRIITTAISSAIYAEGLKKCRVSVENCQEHYGAAWAGYGSTVALDVVGQFIGYKIGGKTGDAISYGSSTLMLSWGAYQWNGGLNKPKEAHETHVDMSGIVLVRH